MKYGIYGDVANKLKIADDCGWGSLGFMREGEEPLLFDTMTEATKAVRDLGPGVVGYGPIQIVGVKEGPATTRQEMVELSGTVDLTGLSFAIYYPKLDGFLGTYVNNPLAFNRAGSLNGGTFPALVFPTQGKMIDALLAIRKRWGGFSTVPARVVGIRTVEVPGDREIVFF